MMPANGRFLKRVQIALLCYAAFLPAADGDDTRALKAMLRKADGGVVRLRAAHVYEISEKLELKSLCPRGVRIHGNQATIKALPNFKHGVLLTSTVLLRDDPYDSRVAIGDLTLDGNCAVGRVVFGNWKHARIDQLTVRGGTVYQVNAIWQNSLLTRISIEGNANQTNNGFDCNLQNSTIYDVTVNMHGNLKESAFWLNGCQHANVVNAYLTDGRTAFGLENCKDVNVVNLKARGDFSFRVANILPAEPSERIHLYNVDLAARHVGEDASTGVHFNATQGGLVAGGRIRTPGPGILLTHGAANVGIFNVDLPSEPVAPKHLWRRSPSGWISEPAGRQIENLPPFVFAGPNRIHHIQPGKRVMLDAVVADELPLSSLHVRWRTLSGPGRVSFSQEEQHSYATFSKPGVYRLMLLASDGEQRSSDRVAIKIVHTDSP